MKKLICMFISLLLLCGCTPKKPINENGATKQALPDAQTEAVFFTVAENGNIVSNTGDEYTFLANETVLCYLGEKEFVGPIQGESEFLEHLGGQFKTGLFSLKNADNDNILIRVHPNSEWLSIYRKASLPPLDYTVDNCIRLEFVLGSGYDQNDHVHATCNNGITDTEQIAALLSEVRAQKDPHEAGLYDLIRKPNGMLENCYYYANIYAFFEEEPLVAVKMNITSFNDLGYSVTIDDKEYVLPEPWLETIRRCSCETNH